MKADFFLARLKQLHAQSRLPHSLSIACTHNEKRLALALQLSKFLFCKNPLPSEFCNTCEACQKINHSNHPDVYIYQPEKNEIPIDDIKKIIRWLNISPHENARKFLHIHEAHRLNASSSNALLKTMEEPPMFAHIFLWSENQSRLLQTILSRSLKCQIHTIDTDETLTEPPIWEQDLKRLIAHKGHAPLDDIFNFSKSIAKQKEYLSYFFSQFYDSFLNSFTHETSENNFLHLNRLEQFHTLLKSAEIQTLNRYGNAQIWIERLLIEWKKLWNLKKT